MPAPSSNMYTSFYWDVIELMDDIDRVRRLRYHFDIDESILCRHSFHAYEIMIEIFGLCNISRNVVDEAILNRYSLSLLYNPLPMNPELLWHRITKKRSLIEAIKSLGIISPLFSVNTKKPKFVFDFDTITIE